MHGHMNVKKMIHDTWDGELGEWCNLRKKYTFCYRLQRSAASEKMSDTEDVLWDKYNPIGLLYKKILRTICKFGL